VHRFGFEFVAIGLAAQAARRQPKKQMRLCEKHTREWFGLSIQGYANPEF
jgi:hypothetical protein